MMMGRLDELDQRNFTISFLSFDSSSIEQQSAATRVSFPQATNDDDEISSLGNESAYGLEEKNEIQSPDDYCFFLYSPDNNNACRSPPTSRRKHEADANNCSISNHHTLCASDTNNRYSKTHGDENLFDFLEDLSKPHLIPPGSSSLKPRRSPFVCLGQHHSRRENDDATYNHSISYNRGTNEIGKNKEKKNNKRKIDHDMEIWLPDSNSSRFDMIMEY
mmetsp:Transcript_3161/g.4207  ORF Transcript_3161/g.4207 Transcript_3161/m.4207 type:complete len:219 (+) Transcript_3161:124-780(+)